MSVYGLSVSAGKVAFNIHLSSLQTTSYIGTAYNASYHVDLRQHIDVSDFQKEYNVTLSMESEMTTDLTTATGINPLESYCIHLGIGPNYINANAFRERITPHFIAFQTQWINGANVYNRFSVGSSDNPPIRVKSLYNVGKIEFEIFSPTVAGQVPIESTASYQVILRFEEV